MARRAYCILVARDAIQAEAKKLAVGNTVLGADCTIPSDIAVEIYPVGERKRLKN